MDGTIAVTVERNRSLVARGPECAKALDEVARAAAMTARRMLESLEWLQAHEWRMSCGSARENAFSGPWRWRGVRKRASTALQMGEIT